MASSASASRSDHLRPADGSPSFAQTTAEFNLDSDLELDLDLEVLEPDADDDLRLHEAGMGGGEAYELRPMKNRRHDEEDEEDSDGWVAPGTRRGLRRGSASTVASFQLYTPDEETAVVRKFDRRLTLFVALLYMLSFLDRSNIGNARIAGMDEDLQSNPPWDGWYPWALTSFYISYIVFEWMALLWKLIPAHIFVAGIVMSWGVTASLQAIAVSYPMLIVLRVLLGIGEAGFTGIPFYLSFFYKRDELAFRTAMFISAAPLATTFASSLAWLITKLGEQSPIAPWRLLFIVEGFPSVLVAVVAWRVIPDSPQTASYLTQRERKVARIRLRNEKPRQRANSKEGITGTSQSQTGASGLRGRELLSVILDPLAWITAAMFFLANLAFSSLPVFLPKILTEMGHDRHASQALTAPPFLLAFIVVLITARLSDRRRSRAMFILCHSLASAAGYAALALAEPLHLSPTLRYIAVYPACIGFFNVITLIIAWNINNQPSESRQGGGFALLQIIGQCGPLVGTRLYPDGDAPYYGRGHLACAIAMLAVAVLALALRALMAYRNRKLERADSGPGAVATGEATEEEEEGLVGRPKLRRAAVQSFRYML
ncbi:major facilitator superfamily transporter [Plectosphaerella plurivora]|uniref:Major facilitator superfamily transporter n=1 Tax=Plectosphaerella plurivora TaxID=936078 RepID=A0A9P8VH71_9PEZI|nr:major facilitator superfamily transporter [Plectosphaerella plurivora]